MMMVTKVLSPGMHYSEGLTLLDRVQVMLGWVSGEKDMEMTGRERQRLLLLRRDW